MLVGTEKPEQIRYVGEALPHRLSASEFFRETGHILKNHAGFKVMLRYYYQRLTIQLINLSRSQSTKRRSLLLTPFFL